MLFIYKYHLQLGENSISMPRGADLLTVQMQHSGPVLWARVDPDAPVQIRHVRICCTGGVVEKDWRYIATFQDGYFVGHAFEVLP